MKHIGNDDEQLLLALVRVESDPMLEPFRRWLEQSQRERELECVRQTEDVSLRRAQGASEELTKLNEQIASARETLKRVRGQ